MKVFDFDNTIYDGESVVDFFLFAMKKKHELIKYLPLMIYTATLYKIGILSIDKLYELSSKMSNVIIKNKEDAEAFIREFWNGNQTKLKKEYLSIISEKDVIISASPRMLLEGIQDKLKTKNVICSEFNIETGKFEFLCFGPNKLIAFKKRFPNATIDEFYTDSKNDKPLMTISKNVHIVKK